MSLTATPMPTVSGAAKVGFWLTADSGTWAPAIVTLKHEWQRNGVAISGATARTYKPTSTDASKNMKVRVTGSKSGYSSVSRTSKAKLVALMNLTTTPTPTISGTAKVGYVLTAVPGTRAPAGTTLKYQWLRDGAAITGAIAKTYNLVNSDASKKIAVKVTGSKSGYK